MLIELKPRVSSSVECPHGGGVVTPERVLWHGLHVCAEGRSAKTGRRLVWDLEVGQAVYTPYVVDVETGEFWGAANARAWFGAPFAESLRNPSGEAIPMAVEVRRSFKGAVVLNCIDYVFGHALLKLLNAGALLRDRPEGTGVVVIVQKPLRWLVPEAVDEVWTVELPFGRARAFYPDFDRQVSEQLRRFERVWLSPAHSHPAQFDIAPFTGVRPHGFGTGPYRITYVWRAGRAWRPAGVSKAFGFRDDAARQRCGVMRVFELLRKRVPEAKLTVAGIGRAGGAFPAWVEDLRVERPTEVDERALCAAYAESRLVIGPHGSNMLLASALAGMTLDLMPPERWGNFAQDVLYQAVPEEAGHPAVRSWRYRFIPEETALTTIADVAAGMVTKWPEFVNNMVYTKRWEA